MGELGEVLEVLEDFCNDTYEPKLFGMHIGSVLSGLDAGNVNTDAKISIVGYGDVWRGVKKRRFFAVSRPWRGGWDAY